jgi:hypothetical protein
MMIRKPIVTIIVASLILAGIYYFQHGPGIVPDDKKKKIEDFLKTVVVDTLEQDYRRHNITITVQVTNITIDRITKTKTKQDNVYIVNGRVSYMIKGKRAWHDKEGNLIQLGPEQEITHWFSCGILEDRYLGALLKDDRYRLQFYADNPMQ